tara:strand:+ start:388 stop:585 length:198 start_codon:yes stop_codon:yes gene_type:complete
MEGEDQKGEQSAADAKGPEGKVYRVTIFTNLPEQLPVVIGESELLSVYLGKLVDRIAANDNGDES